MLRNQRTKCSCGFFSDGGNFCGLHRQADMLRWQNGLIELGGEAVVAGADFKKIFVVFVAEVFDAGHARDGFAAFGDGLQIGSRDANGGGGVGRDDDIERQAVGVEFPGSGDLALDGIIAGIGPGQAGANDGINEDGLEAGLAGRMPPMPPKRYSPQEPSE